MLNPPSILSLSIGKYPTRKENELEVELFEPEPLSLTLNKLPDMPVFKVEKLNKPLPSPKLTCPFFCEYEKSVNENVKAKVK